MLIAKWMWFRQVSAETGPTKGIKKSKIGQVGPTSKSHEKCTTKFPTWWLSIVIVFFLKSPQPPFSNHVIFLLSNYPQAITSPPFYTSSSDLLQRSGNYGDPFAVLFRSLFVQPERKPPSSTPPILGTTEIRTLVGLTPTECGRREVLQGILRRGVWIECQ